MCTCVCASNVSLYRRTHVHPYLPGRTHQFVFIHMYTSVYYTHNQYLCTWTVTHIYTVAGESYANIMGRGRHRGLHPPPPCCTCVNPLKCIKADCRYYCLGHLEDLFSCSTPVIQLLVSHAASLVKSAVSVNSMGYSTKHTSVPQFIAQLLISSFIYV